MKKPSDAIRLLNSVINSVVNKEMPCDVARTLIYASSQVVRAFEVTDIEKRICALEELQQEGKIR